MADHETDHLTTVDDSTPLGAESADTSDTLKSPEIDLLSVFVRYVNERSDALDADKKRAKEREAMHAKYADPADVQLAAGSLHGREVEINGFAHLVQILSGDLPGEVEQFLREQTEPTE